MADSNEAEERAERERTIASLREEHKFIKAWNIAGFGLVVCRRMRRNEMHTFTRAGNKAQKEYDRDGDPTKLNEINETAVKTCCVWPQDRETLTKLFDEYPNFAGGAAVAIAKLGEEGIEELGKE